MDFIVKQNETCNRVLRDILDGRFIDFSIESVLVVHKYSSKPLSALKTGQFLS